MSVCGAPPVDVPCGGSVGVACRARRRLMRSRSHRIAPHASVQALWWCSRTCEGARGATRALNGRGAVQTCWRRSSAASGLQPSSYTRALPPPPLSHTMLLPPCSHCAADKPPVAVRCVHAPPYVAGPAAWRRLIGRSRAGHSCTLAHIAVLYALNFGPLERRTAAPPPLSAAHFCLSAHMEATHATTYLSLSTIAPKLPPSLSHHRSHKQKQRALSLSRGRNAR